MNEQFFSKIDDNVAYWIGFIAADGSVDFVKNRLSFGLSSKDKEHLQKLQEVLQCKNPITERNTLCNNGKRYPSCYLNIYNKQIVDDLSNYGIINRKSYKNIDFLSYIPEQYKFAFICGLFDGDGWFTNTEKNINFGICGSENCIKSVYEFLQKRFNWKDLKIHNYFKSITTFYFVTKSRKKILDFVEDYLKMQNKCNLLERKKKIALNIKEKFDNIDKNNKNESNNKNVKHITKICPICNKQFICNAYLKQVYCSQECSHIAQRQVDRPTRERLKQLIRNMSFTTIGKQFGVSDNAIRKWCKTYNLPFRVKDIKKYSNEEWLKI